MTLTLRTLSSMSLSSLHKGDLEMHKSNSSSSMNAVVNEGRRKRSRSLLGLPPPPPQNLCDSKHSESESALNACESERISSRPPIPTSSGVTKSQLVKILARGASSATKVAGFCSNPLNPLTGALAHSGSEKICSLIHLDHAQQQGAETGWERLRKTMSISKSAGSLSGIHNIEEEKEANSSSTATHHKSKSVEHSIECKALSLVLSLAMGAACQMNNISMPDLSFLSATTTPSELSGLTVDSVSSRVSPFEMESVRVDSSPPIQSSTEKSSTTSTLLSSDVGRTLAKAPSTVEMGMVSTVMMLLRAGGKLIPDELGNVLESVLDSVSESIDDGDSQPRIPGGCAKSSSDNRSTSIDVLGGLEVTQV